MYAVIETGGKQYRVGEGDTVYLEKLDILEGEEVTFDKVLFVSAENDKGTVGAPYVNGASVKAVVIKHGKSKKITVFTYRSKKDSKRKIGHRQQFTKVEIISITA